MIICRNIIEESEIENMNSSLNKYDKRCSRGMNLRLMLQSLPKIKNCSCTLLIYSVVAAEESNITIQGYFY